MENVGVFLVGAGIAIVLLVSLGFISGESRFVRALFQRAFLQDMTEEMKKDFDEFTKRPWTLRDARVEQKSLQRKINSYYDPSQTPFKNMPYAESIHRRFDFLTEIIAELETKPEPPPDTAPSLKESIEQLARKHVKDMVEFDKLCHELELEYPTLVTGTDGLKHFWRNFKENQRHRILGKK